MTRTTRSNPDGENTGVILFGLLVSGAVVVGLVLWGRSRAALPSAAPSAPSVTPASVRFPDLAVGDIVEIDPAAANVPEAQRSGGFVMIAQVDLILTDKSLVSVRAQTTPFAGTIPRSSIVRVLVKPAPGVFT